MMLPNEFHIPHLIAGHLRDDLNTFQQAELQKWLEASPVNQKLFEECTSAEKLSKKLQTFHHTDKMSVWNKTVTGIKASSALPVAKKQKSISKKSKFVVWLRLTAAACILLAGTWLVYTYLKHDGPAVLPLAKQHTDITPGKQTATLTLSNGQRVILSEANNGQLAQQAGVTVSKTANGQLIYTMTALDKSTVAGGSKKELSYNILTTALGEKYQVVLPDGTKVWLNTGSSLKFPVSFKEQNKRKVELTGEAYFEVAKIVTAPSKGKIAKKIPFIVSTAHQEVEVLGTQFNINSYSDEVATCTSLLEGSVKIHYLTGNADQLLKAGQQSVLIAGQLAISEADVENAIAWKNGDFVFKNEDFKTIMRKIARWYNVEIIYDPAAPTDVLLGGKISNSKNLSTILSVIEATADVHFKVEGRRVTVTR